MFDRARPVQLFATAAATPSSIVRTACHGGSHKPPHSPDGGRRTSSNFPSRSTSTATASTVRGGRFALGAGNAATASAARARQCAASGQREQPGDAGVHTVAPSSIIAWLKSPACTPPSARTSSPARCHTRFFSPASSAAPASASTRARTRTTLPSTIGAASPNAMLAMAPAVYSPTPRSARSRSAVAGNAPPYVLTTSRAAACRLRARA